MNNFLSGVIFCCQTGPFPAETAVKSSRLPVLDMFINIRHIRGFNKTLRKIFVNNISWILVIEIYHTEKNYGYANIWCITISKFSLREELCLKNNCLFLVIGANFPCKTKRFELEVIGLAILETGFCF